MVEQDGACAVCGRRFEDINQAKAPAVDHDHSCCPTGKTCGMCDRGALCQPCNMGLGYFYEDTDSLTNAIAYLEFWKVRHDEVRMASRLGRDCRVLGCDHDQPDGCYRCCTYCDYEEHKCDSCGRELEHLHCGHSATVTCSTCVERDRLLLGDASSGMNLRFIGEGERHDSWNDGHAEQAVLRAARMAEQSGVRMLPIAPRRGVRQLA